MDKIAFVFSGQGAQYPGMGKSLAEVSPAAKGVFDLADTIRPQTSSQCFTGTKEELTDTKNTQPCLYCVDLAAAEALKEAGINADMAAGFSLGEIAALTFTGITSKEDGFNLVCRRGELMAGAAAKFDSAMVAVVKLTAAKVEEICATLPNVYPVNYNSPGQTVVAGHKENLADLKVKVKEAGGRCIPLKVSGGFHSPFMTEASEQLKETLKNYSFGSAKIPLYANYTAMPYGDNAQELLGKQICNPVRWQETIENMIKAGADTFIEVGPGKTLCGLISKINPNVRVYNVEDADTLKQTIEEVSK